MSSRFYVRKLAGFGLGAEVFWSVFGALLCVWLSVKVEPATAQSSPPRTAEDVEHCRAIADDRARLHCYEAATSGPRSTAQQLGMGTWHLVRTKDPAGGRDAVSIMQTADITKSDIDLAGLMLRCAETGVEVAVVLVEPLPPRAHPTVIVSTDDTKKQFSATVLPPGAAVLLPKEASALVSGPWTVAPALSVQVEGPVADGEPYSVKGTIPLAGLASALATLRANCAQR